MAQDFSAIMVGLPAHDSVNELRAEMWTWIEEVNKREPADSGKLNDDDDPNDKTLINLNYGLSDYGKLAF
jgi:hypothetical protein